MAFTNLIKNEIRKVKSGNLGWRQIDVSCDGKSGSYLDPTGLAAARMEVRALRVVMMPALAMETVCCS